MPTIMVFPHFPRPSGTLRLDRVGVLDVEHGRVCARIRHLNDALAWAAARWAVNQAAELGARVIYLEDLATLETRCSDPLHLAAVFGISTATAIRYANAARSTLEPDAEQQPP